MSVFGSAAIMRTFTAAKEHACSQCREPIQPGEKYLRVAIPAWADYEGDVDDDGRSVAFLRSPEEREWTTLRFHLGAKACDLVFAGHEA